jgi:hypothetical protein
MSQATVELVRRHYAQIQQYLRNPASDFDRRLAEFLDDLAEPRYGHAGVRQYVEMLFEAIEDYRTPSKPPGCRSSSRAGCPLEE